MDNYKKRINAIKDVIAGAEWLIKRNYTDPEHLGIYGASYGGYAVLMALKEKPQLFSAAAVLFPVTDVGTFLESSDSFNRKLRQYEFGPLSDKPFLESISPLHTLKELNVPLLVAHGEQDSRSPFEQSSRLVDALRKKGCEVEFLTFPDEGHGFRKQKNLLLFRKRMAELFERHLVTNNLTSSPTSQPTSP